MASFLFTLVQYNAESSYSTRFFYLLTRFKHEQFLAFVTLVIDPNLYFFFQHLECEQNTRHEFSKNNSNTGTQIFVDY